jgi:predicted permease
MNTWFDDLRFAQRQLRKSPAFTIVALLTLALGIGANTAIFSVVNALLLKQLPVRDPHTLVIVGDPQVANSRSNGTPRTDVFSYPLYKELRDGNTVFNGLSAAATDHRIAVDQGRGEQSSEQVVGRMVSGDYFELLGINAAAGRLFSDSDDTAESANPVVVLSYSFWRDKFALSPAALGSQIRLNGYPFTIVGVTPPGFDGDVVGEHMALFVPLSMQPEIVRGRHWRNAPNTSWLALIGRLPRDTTLAQAEANVNLVFRRAMNGAYGASISSDDRNALRNATIKVSPGSGGLSELRADFRTPLLLLMGIVGLVLLIACVNVGNLLLARASVRSKEIAVRIAIGASRRRLLRQLLTESLVLALLGGVFGGLLAAWAVPVLVRLFGTDTSLPLSPDLRLLGFSFAVTLVTGLLFGLMPARRTLGVPVSPTLKDAAPGRLLLSRFSWSKVLIAGQVALSLLVLFAAGLLVRSLQKLMAQDFGYPRSHLVIARLDPTAAGYSSEKMKLLADRLSAQLTGNAGVRTVTYSSNGLFANSESGDAILVPGFETQNAGDRVAYEDYVGPGYFAAVGIPILLGRGIEASDTASSLRVVVVNEAMVRRFFAGQNPIGRQFFIDDPDWRDKPLTIVGVSRDAKDHGSGLREQVPPRFYHAFQQTADPSQIVLEVKTEGSPAAAIASLTSQIKSVDASLPIPFIATLEDRVTRSALNHIAFAKLSGFFGALALALACIGLYGLMSFSVAGRTREIGVRMALGGRRLDVLRLVLSEAMVLVVLGLVAGVPLSLAGSQFLHSFLFGVNGADPLALLAVISLLGAVATVAGFLPARRASMVDPNVALRYE